MKIHQFVYAKIENVGSHQIPVARCLLCGRKYHLWQYELENMPYQMACCPKGKQLSLLEML